MSMEITKAYRYRLYPNKDQMVLFEKSAGCCRLVFNECLAYRSEDYQHKIRHNQMDRHVINTHGLITSIPKWKKIEEYRFLKEVPSQILQQALKDLDNAFNRFFKKQAGYPTFRKKYQNDSFRFPSPEMLEFTDSHVSLPKIGCVKWKRHRSWGRLKKIHNATVIRESMQWYISIQVTEITKKPRLPKGKMIGVDLGITCPVVLSDGSMSEFEKTTDRDRRKEKVLHQKLSRKQKGSNNRKKALFALRRHKARLKRKRKDQLNKVTTHLAKNHKLICVEDLKIRNMTKSAKGTAAAPGRNVRAKADLNRSILDVSPGMFRTMLQYKCSWYGSELVLVPPEYTSQTCHACGHKEKKNRTSRDGFHCRKCGHEDHADINAAKNILKIGKKLRIENGNKPSGRRGSLAK